MNLIQFKQIEGLETSLTNANALTTGVSGLLRGQILDILTGDSSFSGDKIFANSVTFYEPVTGASSGNFQGGLWVGADKVLTAADTGSVFVTLVGDQNITGVKTFQGGEENTNFRGGVVSLLPWGSPGESVPQLRVTGELWITGSDGSPVQVVNSGTPAPVEGGVQINSGGNFGASDQFMWDGATLIVGGAISGENFISTGTWNTTGNGIKYTGGNVGIGDMTGDMSALLHLQGTSPDIRLTNSLGGTSGNSFEIKYDNSSLTIKDAGGASSLLNLSGSSVSITTDNNPLYQGLLHVSGGDVYINDGSLYISGQAVLPGGGTTTGIISGGTITSTGIISGGSTIITTGTVEGGTVTGTSGLFETLWITGSDGSWIQITGAGGGGGGGGGGTCDCTGSLTTTGIISGGSVTTTGIISGGSTIVTTGAVEGGTITSTGMISGGSTIVTTGAVEGGTITSTGMISGGSTIITTGTLQGGTVTGTSGLFENLWITGSDGSWIQITGAGGGGGGGGITINTGVSFQTALTSGVSSQTITFPEALSAVPQVACTIVNSGNGGVIPFSISGTTNSQYVVDFTDVIPNDDYAINTLIGGGNFTSSGGSCDCTGSITTTGIISGGSVTTTGIISGGSTIITTGTVEGGTITSAGVISGGSTIITTGTLQGGTVTGTSGLFNMMGSATGYFGPDHSNAAPSHQLEVSGDVGVYGGVYAKGGAWALNTTGNIRFYKADDGSAHYCNLVGTTNEVGYNLTNSQSNWTLYIDDSSYGDLANGGIAFYGGSPLENKMVITEAGQVGIGVSNPTDVYGRGIMIKATGSSNNSTGNILFQSADATQNGYIRHIDSGVGTERLALGVGGWGAALEALSILNNKNVGVGVTLPSYNLEVTGIAQAETGRFTSLWITGSDGNWLQITGAAGGGGGGGGGGTTINSGISFQTALTSGVSSQTITFPEALSAVPQVACTIVNSGNGGVIPFSISGTTNSQYVVDFTDVIPNDDYAINTLIGGGNFTSTWTTGSAGITYTDGNVGIGTESPTAKLDIVNDVAGFDVDAHLVVQNGNNPTDGHEYAGIGFSVHSNVGDGNLKNYFGVRASSAGSSHGQGDFVFLADNASDNNAVTSGEEVARITSAGDVGIGTVPVSKLTVAVANSDDGILIKGDLDASVARLYQDGTSSNGRLVLYKGGTPWASLNEGGSTISGCTLSYGFTNEFFNRTAEWNATLALQCSGIGTTGLRVMNEAHTENVFSVTNEGHVGINQRGFLEWDEGASALSLSASGGAPTNTFLVHSGGGVVLPRLTNAEMSSISGPTDGEMIYNTSENAFYGYENGVWVNLRS